jgi:hypothetical protein
MSFSEQESEQIQRNLARLALFTDVEKRGLGYAFEAGEGGEIAIREA